jgi:hypothetical protein
MRTSVELVHKWNRPGVRASRSKETRMKHAWIVGARIAVAVLVSLTAGQPRPSAAQIPGASGSPVVDLRPILEGCDLSDGLVPLHVTTQGVQLWARVRTGKVRAWIVTDSQLLERALGGREEWRGSEGLLWSVMKHPSLYLVPSDGIRGDGLVPIQLSPGGFQLWGLLRGGEVTSWIVTHGVVLEAILADLSGWSYTATTWVATRAGEDPEVYVSAKTVDGTIYWRVPY